MTAESDGAQYRCFITDANGNMGSTRCATVKLDVRDWTMEYEAGGLRTKRSSAEKTYNYIYSGDKLVRMTCGDNILDFTYDANGAPLTLVTGGKVYYYLTNLQGDVISVESSDGTSVASYCYDAWGKILSSSGDLAELNPLRYRGYVYDQETGFYYVESRYYDPAIGRFINADSTPSTGQDVSGTNMYAYCGNNPVSRVDDGGEFWNIAAGAVIGGALSVTIQIVANLATGEKWSSGVLMAAVTGAASGALSATGAGKVIQVIGNGAISLASETINQVKSGTLATREGLMAIATTTGAGAIGGLIGGDGMRHKSGNYYKAATSAKDTALKVFGKTYGNARTPAKLLGRAVNTVKKVGYKESIITGIKFILGGINSQLLTRGKWKR